MPSNFGMCDGSFIGMGVHKYWWKMGSFVNLAKSGKFIRAMKGIFDPKLMWDGVVTVVGFPGA